MKQSDIVSKIGDKLPFTRKSTMMVSLRTENPETQLSLIRHEIRNRLTSMSLATSLIASDLDDEKQATLQLLKHGLRDIEDLVNKLR